MPKVEESAASRTLKAGYLPQILSKCMAFGLTTPKTQRLYMSFVLGRQVGCLREVSSSEAGRVLTELDTDRGAMLAVLVATYESQKWELDFVKILVEKHTGKKRVSDCSDEELYLLLDRIGAMGEAS